MKKNFLHLFESELAKAEVTLAVKDISDRLQKMASDISKTSVDDIPSVVERIKVSHGVDTGNAFGKMVQDELNTLTQNILEVKSKIDDQSLVLSGDAKSSDLNYDTTSMGSDMDMDSEMDDEMDIDSEMDAIDSEMGDKPMKKPEEKPVLGRKLKKGIKNENVNRLIEKCNDSKKKKIIEQMYHAGGKQRQKVLDLAKRAKK